MIYNDDPKTMEKSLKQCTRLNLTYYCWGCSGAKDIELSHKRNLQFLFFNWACCELACNRPMLVICNAQWSHFFWFLVTVSVPEMLDKIENVSANNKENHNTMTKQWTSNGDQRVPSFLYINESPNLFI